MMKNINRKILLEYKKKMVVRLIKIFKNLNKNPLMMMHMDQLKEKYNKIIEFKKIIKVVHQNNKVADQKLI